MEYGEPQFFPGNCVGYLETILEETDEEFEEEEGCSGRHWWTADSDTDTDSVIRVDNSQNQQQLHHSHHPISSSSNQSNVQRLLGQQQISHPQQPPPQCLTPTNLKSVENVEDLSLQSTFRSSASSRPFELEDLHLLDQLDLAFEETLMEPRRRSGFAAFNQLHLLDQPLETHGGKSKGDLLLSRVASSEKGHPGSLQRSVSHDGERSAVFFTEEEEIKPHIQPREIIPYNGNSTTNSNLSKSHSSEDVKLGNAESKETFGSSLSPSSSDSEPHEVAEEDFFYSSPGSDESEEGSCSSDDSEKHGGGVVLAEFSLCKGTNGISGNNSFTSGFGSAKNRRSFDSPSAIGGGSSSASSRLKSFRSFDSLNSLSGTELLFSKADTFPSFHYIKEDVEPGSSGGSGSPSSPRCNLTSSSTNDVPGAMAGNIIPSIRKTCEGAEDESHSLPSHHSSTGLAPSFTKITKKNSYSSSTSTASSSSNSASGMMSTENLSEDSGIGGPDTSSGGHKHPSVVEEEGKISEQDGVRDSSITQLERESAKEFISSAEFALNPLVFSSLSSSEMSSNSPSMNSVPSLNHPEDVSSSSLMSTPSPVDSEKVVKAGESPLLASSSCFDDAGSHNSEHKCNNLSSSESNLMKMGNENTSFHTPQSTNHPEEETKRGDTLKENHDQQHRGKEANQSLNNQSDGVIDEASEQQYTNDNGGYSTKNEEDHSGLHPESHFDMKAQNAESPLMASSSCSSVQIHHNNSTNPPIANTAECAKSQLNNITSSSSTTITTTITSTSSHSEESSKYKDIKLRDNPSQHEIESRREDPLKGKCNQVANIINVPLDSTITGGRVEILEDSSREEEQLELPLPFEENSSKSKKLELSQQNEETRRQNEDRNSCEVSSKPLSSSSMDPPPSVHSHNSLIVDGRNKSSAEMNRDTLTSVISSEEDSIREGVGVSGHSSIRPPPPKNKKGEVPYHTEENEIQVDETIENETMTTKQGWNVIKGNDEIEVQSHQQVMQESEYSHESHTGTNPCLSSLIANNERTSPSMERRDSSSTDEDESSSFNSKRRSNVKDLPKRAEKESSSSTSRQASFRRERSNSESEFESAESAVEEDMALAYAIVINSSPKGSSPSSPASSSPTRELADKVVNSPDVVRTTRGDLLKDGESGPVSTLMGLPLPKADEEFYGVKKGESSPINNSSSNASSKVDYVKSLQVDNTKSKSSSPSHEDDVTGQEECTSNIISNDHRRIIHDIDHIRTSGGTTGDDVTEGSDGKHESNINPGGVKNASILLRNLDDTREERGDESFYSKITYQQQHNHQQQQLQPCEYEAGESVVIVSGNPVDDDHEFNCDDKNAGHPSRSVGLGISSSTEVNKQQKQHSHESSSVLTSSSSSSVPGVVTVENSKVIPSSNNAGGAYHQERKNRISSSDDYIIKGEERDETAEEDEQGELVLAKPIDPVHIGVAEVKKFTSSVGDSSCASRKSHRKKTQNDDHHQHEITTLVRDEKSDSENIIRPTTKSSSSNTTNIISGSSNSIKTKGDEAILGHSNFGFFGRSCGGNRSAAASVTPNPSQVSSSLSQLPVSSLDSSSIVAYGFPPSSASGYPSLGDLHIDQQIGVDQDQHLKEVGPEYYNKQNYWKESSLSGLESGANSKISKVGGSCTSKLQSISNSIGIGKKRGSSSHPSSSSFKDQGIGDLHLEDIKCGIHPENFTIPLGVYSAAVIAVAPSIPSKRLVFVNAECTASNNTNTAGSGEPNIRLHERDQEEKSGSPINNRYSSSSSGSSLSNETGGTASTANGPFSYVPPDVLALKQTSLNSGSSNSTSECDKVKSPEDRMEGETIETSHSQEQRRSVSPAGGIVKTRTYGPRKEVEVVLVSSRTPSPAPPLNIPTAFPPSSLKQPQVIVESSLHEQHNITDPETTLHHHHDQNPTTDPPPAKFPRTRVHFSPVVSEISWRESYIDQSSDFSGSSEDIHQGVRLDSENQYPENTTTTSFVSSTSNCQNEDEEASSAGGTHSGVRPLFVSQSDRNNRSRSSSRDRDNNMSQVDNNLPVAIRQPSPSSRGPILVEKVEMRSSFLHGCEDDEEDDDELERKLTAAATASNSRERDNNGYEGKVSSVDEEDNFYEDGEFLDGTTKESVEFKSAKRQLSFEVDKGDVLDLYEDVNVEIKSIENANQSTTLSMVPDLLSQCENASNAQTHIDVSIEETDKVKGNVNKPFRKSHSPTPQQQQPATGTTAATVVRKSEIPPPPPTRMESVGLTSNNRSSNANEDQLNYLAQQQQIFPKMFAEDSSSGVGINSKGNGKSPDSKTNSSSSLNKSKKSGKGFSLGSKKSSDKEKDKEVGGMTGESGIIGTTSDAKENKTKGPSKPGFFERLSKIRLSGSKSKKQKVHPKADDEVKGAQPLRSANAVNVNGNSSSNGMGSNVTTNGKGSSSSSHPHGPILKKSPANQPTPVIPNYTLSDMENDSEPDETHHQAFENILEEIAGIKSIKIRMDKSNGSNNGNGSGNNSTPPVKEMRSFAKRKQFYSSADSNATSSSVSPPPLSPGNARSCSDLDRKLSQFKEETSKTRVLVSKSHPDLELIEDMVRQQSASPELLMASDKSPESKKSPKKSSGSETGQKNEREWYKLLKSAAEKYYYRGSNKEDKSNGSNSGEAETTRSEAAPAPVHSHHHPPTKTGIVETDLDTGASREILDAELLELEKVPLYTVSTSEIPSVTASNSIITTTASSPSAAAKARSLTNLSTRLPLSVAPSSYNDDDVDHAELNDFDERAKSYEFLLDDNQKSSSVPPENKLRLETRQLSEHELRIQRSLQRLNVPEWFKKHETTSGNSAAEESTPTENKQGTLKILSRRTEYGSAGGLAGGWTGLSAFKAPSMSSLQSSNGGRYSGSLNRSNFVRGRPATMSATRLSKESLAGGGSASHSPSAFDRCSFTYGMPFSMTRFSQSRMSTNSGSVTPNSTTPDTSLTPGTTTAPYVKKPYMGWRSQERLNALSASTNGSSTNASGPPKLSVYLPPEERLAADLLKSKITIRPPLSDRPPLPKPPARSEKTALSKSSSVDNHNQPQGPSATSTPTTTTNTSSIAVVTKISHNNSIPAPTFEDDQPANVHESIREVTQAINQFVSKGQDRPPKPQPRKKSPGRQAIWIESSFVGQKPVRK